MFEAGLDRAWRVLAWEIGGAVLVGAATGWITAKGMDRARGRPDAEGTSLLTVTISLALATTAGVRLLGGDDATWSLLIVFQAMDAAGKDSSIKHVMSGINPQGVAVTSFKQPGPEALAHDFLWRVGAALPARGMIGIFNRSHYEEVLVTRVHPDLLDGQNIPAALRGDPEFWARRLEDIAGFERHLAHQGTIILKFFLNVSPAEQKRRFLDRLDEKDKHWKFSSADLRERALWDRYMDAYGHAIAATAFAHAPWFVVPADQKWFARLVIVEAINEALASLSLHAVTLSDEAQGELAAARERLCSE